MTTERKFHLALPIPNTSQAKKLTKVIKYLAKGYSNRTIESTLKVDKSKYRLFLLSSNRIESLHKTDKLSCSPEYSTKVCEDVLKNNLTYIQAREKWGVKGLTALHGRWYMLKAIQANILTKKIVHLRNQGQSFQRISPQVGISAYSTNVAYRRANNYKTNINMQRIAGEKIIQQTLAMYRNGATKQEIAIKLQRTPTHIGHILLDNDLSTKKVLDKDYLLKLHALRKRNMSWKEIGFIFSVRPSTAASTYRNHQLEVLQWTKE